MTETEEQKSSDVEDEDQITTDSDDSTADDAEGRGRDLKDFPRALFPGG